nr:RNA-directed DNA polymerase homolog [Tanacetum cinerariifolium]
MDYDSCKKEWGNGCGSNETPTKRVDGNLHGSSIRERGLGILAHILVNMNMTGFWLLETLVTKLLLCLLLVSLDEGWIKCKDKSSCDCTHTKKKFHSKRFSSLSGKPWFSRRSSKKWNFIRKKKQCGRTSDRCFICQKRGHFARNFLDKKRSQALIQALNQVEPVDVFDLESLYSLDDEPSDSVLCTIAYSDFSSDDDSDTYSLESDSDFGVHTINPIPHVLPIQEDPPLPLAKIHLLTDAYAKPILIIAFFDIGSLVSILNPNILSDHYWKPHHQNFMAANGEKFVIDKISVLLIFADDKFPLPQKKSLFQHLADARVLSKFDLKSGFWQLGIKPKDRPKTAFCIPDHHYQWKVMPFGLKNAPSAFQKAMITIFEPILANTLSHAELLSKFYSLVTKYGIMLSEKKMEVGNPPQWTSRKTEAVKAIKSLPKKMPPLKILASSEKRILQTDASDECWGAVLLVQDNNNKRHVCGYKSGTFKASEQHYHFTFKEILAFKRKMLPHAQLLRWSNWFSQWKLTVKHIKRTENVLADFLSCPKAYKLEKNYPKDASRVQNHTPHFLLMVFSVTSHEEEGSSSNTTPTIQIEANRQWLYDNFDDFEVETSDDDDDARSLWSSDDDEHLDPFEDDRHTLMLTGVHEEG